jgi:hypothetical protein
VGCVMRNGGVPQHVVLVLLAAGGGAGGDYGLSIKYMGFYVLCPMSHGMCPERPPPAPAPCY